MPKPLLVLLSLFLTASSCRDNSADTHCEKRDSGELQAAE